MKSKTAVGLFFSFWGIYLLILILGCIGWVMNIVKLVHVGFAVSQWGGMEIVRAIGILIAPLGGLLGYF